MWNRKGAAKHCHFSKKKKKLCDMIYLKLLQNINILLL